MVIPSIVLVSIPGGEEPGGEESSSPDVNWESNCEERWREGLSDESDDSEITRDLKKRIREGKSEWDLLKREKDRQVRRVVRMEDEAEDDNSEDSSSEDGDSGLEDELTSEQELLKHINNKKTDKEREIFDLKSILEDRVREKRKRDSDDEGDNNRSGPGPSAGTTGGSEGGPSEGGSSEGGSSGGVEGSSRVIRESPIDYVLEKESNQLPPFDDIE